MILRRRGLVPLPEPAEMQARPTRAHGAGRRQAARSNMTGEAERVCVGGAGCSEQPAGRRRLLPRGAQPPPPNTTTAAAAAPPSFSRLYGRLCACACRGEGEGVRRRACEGCVQRAGRGGVGGGLDWR